jgi:hypothetical protein
MPLRRARIAGIGIDLSDTSPVIKFLPDETLLMGAPTPAALIVRRLSRELIIVGQDGALTVAHEQILREEVLAALAQLAPYIAHLLSRLSQYESLTRERHKVILR